MSCHFPTHSIQFRSRIQFVSCFAFRTVAICVVVGSVISSCVQAEKPVANSLPVELKDTGKQVSVKLGDELFTEFDYSDYNKPILYPIFGPGQVGMTRNFPMNEEVEGEAHDHPHHKSMWISHEISGVDFWGESEGKVITEKVETEFSGNPKPANVLRSTSTWRKKVDNTPILTDQTTYWFGGDKKSRWIDCLVKFKATFGDIQFDDTKEGLFAIRTHPDLRLNAAPSRGVEEVFGSAINSEGITGKAIWGKKAKWLLYKGMIDGKPMSIAMYDHPGNLRHPTTWHARDYGLVTANPFGMHHFLNKKKGAGAFRIAKDDDLALRYRVEFFRGEVSPSEVEACYQAFASNKLIEPIAAKN